MLMKWCGPSLGLSSSWSDTTFVINIYWHSIYCVPFQHALKSYQYCVTSQATLEQHRNLTHYHLYRILQPVSSSQLKQTWFRDIFATINPRHAYSCIDSLQRQAITVRISTHSIHSMFFPSHRIDSKCFQTFESYNEIRTVLCSSVQVITLDIGLVYNHHICCG